MAWFKAELVLGSKACHLLKAWVKESQKVSKELKLGLLLKRVLRRMYRLKEISLYFEKFN